MCLHAVTQTYNKTSMKIHVGYKVFRVREYWEGQVVRATHENSKSGLFFPYFQHKYEECKYNANYSKPVPQGEWLVSKPDKLIDYDCKPYTAGFHIFLKIEDARKWAKAHYLYTTKDTKLVTVLFRDVMHKGTDEMDPVSSVVIVAREMLVSKEVHAV